MFSQACAKNSVHGEGGFYPIACWDVHPPPGQTPTPRQTPPRQTPHGQTERHPLSRRPLGRHPLPGPEMATAVDGTHPTGMHSYM